MTQNALARLLKPFEVFTGDHWTEGGRNLKGYALADFKEVFRRYIRTTATSAKALEPVTNGHGKPENSASPSGLAVVAVAGNHARPERIAVPGYRPLDDDEFPDIGNIPAFLDRRAKH